MLCWSLVRILKLRPLWVCAGVVITIVSVFLTDALIAKAKISTARSDGCGYGFTFHHLAVYKRKQENREWALSS